LIVLIGLPHAEYDFAKYEEMSGTRSKNFLPEYGSLIHGNELLSRVRPDYDKVCRYAQREHTVRLVMALLTQYQASSIFCDVDAIKNGADCFVGYLLFDAWISNTDRHHENWGMISVWDNELLKQYIAPSFDHASSLGCRESLKAKQDRMITKDKNRTVERLVKNAKSALYKSPSDHKPLTTHEAFREASKYAPQAAEFWMKKLQGVNDDDIAFVFDKMPEGYMEQIDIDFAKCMLSDNKKIILEELELNSG